MKASQASRCASSELNCCSSPSSEDLRLLAAYALTDRHQQPKAVTARDDYNSTFSSYDLQRIRNLYATQLPHPDPAMQASIQELYRGLRLAGVPER